MHTTQLQSSTRTIGQEQIVEAELTEVQTVAEVAATRVSRLKKSAADRRRMRGAHSSGEVTVGGRLQLKTREQYQAVHPGVRQQVVITKEMEQRKHQQTRQQCWRRLYLQQAPLKKG